MAALLCISGPGVSAQLHFDRLDEFAERALEDAPLMTIFFRRLNDRQQHRELALGTLVRRDSTSGGFELRGWGIVRASGAILANEKVRV